MPCVRVEFNPKLLSEELDAEADYLASKERPLHAEVYRLRAQSVRGTTKDRMVGFDDSGFMCGSGVIPCTCGFAADYLCDGPDGKGGTCDIALCERCRTNIGPDLDLCRVHAVLLVPH